MVSLRITPDYTSDRADVVGLLYGNDNATVTIANFADELRATSRVRIVLNDDTLLTVGSLTPENENDVRGNLIVRGVPLIEHISRKMREPTQVGVKVIIDDAEDESAPTYTGRTMLLLNWDEHDPSNPEPSVPGNYIPVTSIANLPDHYKDSDMKAKIDEICAIIRQSATALAFAFLLPFFSQAASVQVFTADKQDIYNDGKIVTNVTLDASGLATDEQVQANSEKIAAVSNDVRTVDAKVETHKVREDNPHNVTADQVGAYTKDETDSKIAGHVPPPPPNYDVVSNRAMTALQSYTETDPVFAAWLALGPFAPFATMEWVNGRGFATQNWVGEQGFLKSYTETDPTVPGWAKQADKPSYTATEVGALPNNRVQLIVNPNFQGAVKYVQDKPNSSEARVLPEYLHEREFDSTYPDDAKWYYDHADYDNAGACSVRRAGNIIERNFDWKYNWMPEFLIRVTGNGDRFASLGIANVGDLLTEADVTSGKWSPYFRCLPGHTVDGVNEKSVFCEVNVVDGEPDWDNPDGDIHPLGGVRWVLDYGTNAQQAAEALAARVKFPQGWSQNFHYLVADKTSTYIVENGEAHPVNDGAVMTNFKLYPNRDTNGAGQERYDLLDDGEPITNAWWTLAYLSTTSPVRVSDIGTDTNAIFAAWANGDRESHRGQSAGGKTWWQTVHTAVYDISDMSVKVAVQEKDLWYEFRLRLGGGGGGIAQETDPVWNAEKSGYVPWANAAHNAVTIGNRASGSAIGDNSLAQGSDVQATGRSTHAEGEHTIAEGFYTHAEGCYTHAEGIHTHAEGYSAHAEGEYTHAEGHYTRAEGHTTHAEGYETIARGRHTHAEGGKTTAGNSDGNYGRYAHAAGFNAYATNVTAFAWNGSASDNPSDVKGSETYTPPYGDHGPGTYNINPVGGLYGFWIGESNIGSILEQYVSRDELVETVNRVKDLHWDPGLEVTWTNIVVNGHIYYVTVTNTNVSTL